MSFYQSEFESPWITLLLRVMNGKVFCERITIIFVLNRSPVLVTSAVCRVARLSPVVSYVLTTQFALTFINSSTAMVSQSSSISAQT